MGSAGQQRTVELLDHGQRTPAEISRAYALATGTPPMMRTTPWKSCNVQTPLSYAGAAGGSPANIAPQSAILSDRNHDFFFHWPNQGDWMFDARDC